MMIRAAHYGCAAFLLAEVMLANAWAAPPANSQQAVGHRLFSSSCAYCHGQRGYATALLAQRLGANEALLESRTDLSPLLIRQVVRHGVRGMPWYRRAELSNDDLDAVIAYLTAPKNAP